jgi:hypothetical protein
VFTPRYALSPYIKQMRFVFIELSVGSYRVLSRPTAMHVTQFCFDKCVSTLPCVILCVQPVGLSAAAFYFGHGLAKGPR